MLCLQGRILGQVKGFPSHFFKSDLTIWREQYQVGFDLFYCDDMRVGGRESGKEGERNEEGREGILFSL